MEREQGVVLAPLAAAVMVAWYAALGRDPRIEVWWPEAGLVGAVWSEN